MEMPAGWSDAPHEVDPGILNEPFPDVGGAPPVMVVPPRTQPMEVDISTPEPPVRNIDIFAREDLAEFVDLSDSFARFMGHEVRLDADSVAAIKMILAQAITEDLRKEQQRVLDSVQQGVLPGRAGGRVPDVQPMSRVASPVEPQASLPGQVHGVREPGPTRGPQDVRPVPRKKARKARTRTTRPRVPHQDDPGVPPA